jgi:hypothetical protein
MISHATQQPIRSYLTPLEKANRRTYALLGVNGGLVYMSKPSPSRTIVLIATADHRIMYMYTSTNQATYIAFLRLVGGFLLPKCNHRGNGWGCLHGLYITE